MTARRNGFRSGLSNLDFEQAIFSNTAKAGLKSSGEVKNAFNSKVRAMLDVDSRARGGEEKVSDFAEPMLEISFIIVVSVILCVLVDARAMC